MQTVCLCLVNDCFCMHFAFWRLRNTLYPITCITVTSILLFSLFGPVVVLFVHTFDLRWDKCFYDLLFKGFYIPLTPGAYLRVRNRERTPRTMNIFGHPEQTIHHRQMSEKRSIPTAEYIYEVDRQRLTRRNRLKGIFEFPTFLFLNQTLWCDHSLESSRRDDSNVWLFHRVCAIINIFFLFLNISSWS